MILVIDNYDSFTYNLVQYIAEMEDVIVHRHDETTIEAIRNLNPKGIVISPGPGRPEDAGICVEVIREFSGHIPILGVCLGHQAIGIAFGGRVIQAETIMHGKRSTIKYEENGLFLEFNSPLEVMRYHSLVVDKNTLPSILKVTADSLDDFEIMAIEHQEYPVFGVQFHPESIGTTNGKKLIQNFMDVVRKENGHEKNFTTIK
ncbi:hypothetical protein GCM10008967_19510 [Bacillus carboniphilus]|uniref:Glutamine amidotransferase domain-containing protein n=1 Tax=Bacillus carboniphilus TaxID=86663 RepID=A0ABN0W8S1_9BACI